LSDTEKEVIKISEVQRFAYLQ